jgi:2',3'-cyclic-nucleotide 2'-phosphodiesterase (5'-nucleotidase family)
MTGSVRRSTRLLAATLLATSLLAAVGGGSQATGPQGTPVGPNPASQGLGPHKLIKVQVLSFNDYHGHLDPPAGADATLGATLDPSLTKVGGSEYLSTELNQLRAGAQNSLTVAAGDLIGGSTFLSGLFHDEPSVETLEAMHLDVSSVGNHEFDEGLNELYRMQFGGCHPVDGCFVPGETYDGANFPWLAANVVFKDTGQPVLAPTWTKVIDGVKIGFIGMTLKGTPELVASQGIAGLEFKDEVATANAAARQLQKNNVQAIVVLVHEGGAQVVPAGKYNQCVGISGPIVQIAQNLDPAIDLVVTGHTHQPYVCDIPDPAGNPREVTSASSFGRVVTETWLTIDKFTRDVVRTATTSTNHLVVQETKDPAMTAIVDKWKALSAPIANRVVGTITADITNPGDRQVETSMQNLVADAFLGSTSAPANGGAVMAFVNPGGVRAALTYNQISGGELPGQVIYGEAWNVQPFGNYLATMDLKGSDVKLLLEQQFVPRGTRARLVLGVSAGLTYDWCLSAPFGSAVSNLELNGVPIDPTATYRVATNNFLATGTGDGFTAFANGTNRDSILTDDVTALASYLTANSPLAPTPTDRVNELP